MTGAEGSAYTLENYIGAITKVNVNGTDYNAAGRGAVKTIKSKKLKKKKQVIKGVFSVKNAMGKVTYKVASKSKVLSVKKKNGNITVKKKTKKGTYKFKVAITAARGNR